MDRDNQIAINITMSCNLLSAKVFTQNKLSYCSSRNFSSHTKYIDYIIAYSLFRDASKNSAKVRQ